MAGEGSIQPTLNNNRNLLRKKRYFKKDKSISERKKELLNYNNGTLHFKKIPENELSALKAKIREEAKKKDRKHNIYLLIAFVLTISFIAISLYNTSNYEKELNAKTAAYHLQQNQQEYNIYMEDAEDQFEKEHWKMPSIFIRRH